MEFVYLNHNCKQSVNCVVKLKNFAWQKRYIIRIKKQMSNN